MTRPLIVPDPVELCGRHLAPICLFVVVAWRSGSVVGLDQRS